MKFKDFIKWSEDLYTPPQVNEAGDISGDKVLKFELSYGNTPEIRKTPIVAITLAEALYRSIYTIFIENCPTEPEIIGATTDDAMAELKAKLISLLTFSNIKVHEVSDKSISFIINDIVYTLSSDGYDFTKVYDFSVEDDIVVVWEKPNANDMICYVCYNMTNLAINLKEINKINNLMQLNGLIKNNLFTHSNFLVSKFGFASITDEDVNNNKYSEYFAKEISYKRALIDKLIIDRKLITEQLIALKHDFDLIHTTIKRYYKMRRKATKRIHDLRELINKRISEIYPDAQ